MPLLYNTLCGSVTAFLPRSKCLLISWLQSSPTVVLEPKKIKTATAFAFPHLFAMKWWDQMPWSLLFECWILSQFFHSSLSPSSRSSFLPLHFLPLEWFIICISEAVDISPSHHDSSLCLQPSASHDVLCIWANKQGDGMQPWRTPFPVWSQSVVPCPVLTSASWLAGRILMRQVRWSAIPIFHSLLWPFCLSVHLYKVRKEIYFVSLCPYIKLKVITAVFIGRGDVFGQGIISWLPQEYTTNNT